jgi:hypothetical protein
MKSSDIKIGQLYKNLGFPNIVYLGVGGGMWNDQNKKNLVILNGGMLGILCHLPEKPSNFEFWNNFRELDVKLGIVGLI